MDTRSRSSLTAAWCASSRSLSRSSSTSDPDRELGPLVERAARRSVCWSDSASGPRAPGGDPLEELVQPRRLAGVDAGRPEVLLVQGLEVYQGAREQVGEPGAEPRPQVVVAGHGAILLLR